VEARYVLHLLFSRVSCFVADGWESSTTGNSEENSVLLLLLVIRSNLPAFSIGSLTRWNISDRHRPEATKITVEVTNMDICTVQCKHRRRRTKISTGDKQWQLEWHRELQNAMRCRSMDTTKCNMNNRENINGKKKQNLSTSLLACNVVSLD
jgi:hypothetical protein